MKALIITAILSFALSGHAQFPQDYRESRESFREICPAATNDHFCETFMVDPRDDLSVDAYFSKPAGSKKIMVLVSGVHGIESFAGAAIQLDFLKNQFKSFNEQGISVYLVHALNPWGYLHRTRVTANNIDLNRNFPSAPDANLSVNQGFQKLKINLAAENIGGPGFGSFLSFSMQLLWKIVTFQFSVDEMNQAIAGGQREEARGLFYGGTGTETQILWLSARLDEHLVGFTEALLIDFHTGLGDHGVLHLMPSRDPAPKGQALRQLLFGTDSNAVYKMTTDATKGFYAVAGDFLDFAEERGPPDLTIAAMTMEFGTKGTSIPAQLASLHTMAAENASRVLPWGTDRAHEIAAAKAEFTELFDPNDQAWRESVLRKSRTLFAQVLENWKAQR